MPNYEEETRTIEVPLGTGVPGFLKVLKSVLELGRVQNVSVDKNGLVTYKRFRKEGEPDPVDIDFTSLLPSQVVRSHEVSEIPLMSVNAAVVIGQMFATSAMEGYNPVAFVGSPSTKFWTWYTSTTKLVLGREELYGLPFLADREIPDEALILCVAYGRRASMVDVVRSYKVSIPMQKAVKP